MAKKSRRGTNQDAKTIKLLQKLKEKSNLSAAELKLLQNEIDSLERRAIGFDHDHHHDTLTE